MTLQELMDYGSLMMEKHPEQKDLIFIGVDDCLERCEDNDELIEKMHAWISKICNEELLPTPADEK
jgi:hypothetical protein